LAEDGVLAELEDFDFDFKYTVTQFRVEISAAGGYVNFFESNSNRFTEEQKNQFRRLNPNSLIYIANIKAVGTDGVSRDLDPISFKIQ
ncbi:MAG: gliding motility protein GldM, partial [Bacteroidales bacterium]|nr:gliding motility protein GldM [Bacteroidales bacterium]